MSDIALFPGAYLSTADIQVSGDLVADGGLATAVLISLFTDRRISTEELLHGETDKRGWWAREIGSRLWLLQRSKTSSGVPPKAHAYIKEALEWLLEDQIVERIEINVEWINRTRGWLGFQIRVHPADGSSSELFNYQYNWRNHEVRNT